MVLIMSRSKYYLNNKSCPKIIATGGEIGNSLQLVTTKVEAEYSNWWSSSKFSSFVLLLQKNFVQ